ncbi:transglycosylase domain-containing protein [Methyloceanibacter superfactus]|uniref:transglycosylase domain-containing protein n=1 Tax=Methyloceanibacter superfactus TaxID=1774969 RepID=UPI000AF8C2F1|nr:transglycosylase domain-containing protein [Methyloceanibacter superfactus]
MRSLVAPVRRAVARGSLCSIKFEAVIDGRSATERKAAGQGERGAKRRPEPGIGARRKAPAKRRPQARRKGRLWRLKRAVQRHPVAFKIARFGLLACIWGTIVFGGAVVYFIAQVPDPILATLDDRPPNVTILAADGTVLAERGLRRGHVRVDVLPKHLIEAVTATEDRRFYHHFGIDPIGLVRATYRNFRAGTVVEGGSTITQQLAKNLFLKPDRTLTRKLEELVYAVWLEQRFTKDEILELYLNRVYFGGGTYGVEAAARHYFGKSARVVSLPQAALLAGLLKAPSRYAPTRSVRLASARADEVLDNMVEAGSSRRKKPKPPGARRSNCGPRATRRAIPMPSIGWRSYCRNMSASTKAISSSTRPSTPTFSG